MIQVANVVKYHGAIRILDGVSVAFEKGQVAGIIGPSGSGKSTLLRCINGLERFQEGAISVGDTITLAGGIAAPPTSTLLALRRTVGMVFQQFNLFPHMTVLENVMSGALYSLGNTREQAEPVARSLLERVGLADKASAKPAQLSGGQQQRVAIARALAVNPAAILFDEPTSALDPKMSAEVMRVIDDLAGDERLQTSMVIVTHDIPALRQVADRIVILERGKVVYSGPTDEAFCSGGPAALLHA